MRCQINIVNTHTHSYIDSWICEYICSSDKQTLFERLSFIPAEMTAKQASHSSCLVVVAIVRKVLLSFCPVCMCVRERQRVYVCALNVQQTPALQATFKCLQHSLIHSCNTISFISQWVKLGCPIRDRMVKIRKYFS